MITPPAFHSCCCSPPAFPAAPAAIAAELLSCREVAAGFQEKVRCGVGFFRVGFSVLPFEDDDGRSAVFFLCGRALRVRMRLFSRLRAPL